MTAPMPYPSIIHIWTPTHPTTNLYMIYTLINTDLKHSRYLKYILYTVFYNIIQLWTIYHTTIPYIIHLQVYKGSYE